ncbi:MAG: ferredoxin [Gemmatimonadales bacterium]
MSQYEERVVHGLKIRIDRDLCVGFADCVAAAPEAFQLDDAGTVVFVRPEAVARERLITASDLCPVDAITVWDEEGRQVVPT